jgi:hypothetical protein
MGFGLRAGYRVGLGRKNWWAALGLRWATVRGKNKEIGPLRIIEKGRGGGASQAGSKRYWVFDPTGWKN